MPIKRIGSRGALVSFNDPFYTNVYIIFGDEHVFVLDTFLGNDSMEVVKQLIREEGYAQTPVVVFNSHADYDHYWGNSAFEGATIVGHVFCKERVLNEGKTSLTKYADHQKGNVQLVPPNQTFQETFSFNGEQVKFIHSPGHTRDSSTCIDERDGVLFVGDNVESPIPYLNHANFDEYVRTLKSYLNLDWRYLVTGHDPLLVNSELIERNIRYLLGFREWSFDIESFSAAELHRHVENNLKTLNDELMGSKHRQALIQHLEELRDYSLHSISES
ncbi:MAG: MBL fold metallo-hydrolase [Candidatus Thorarchaeota archaeon]|nr:MBL fold metallo-hydrolase [Candidatus Thorarchaeota archaeon]